jgi:hypothetical protein
VTGVVTAPVDGLKKGGVLGLFKGIGFGVTGLVVKPLVCLRLIIVCNNG